MCDILRGIDEIDGNQSFNEKRSMWNAELGYPSEELKNYENRYPRPGIGMKDIGISFHFFKNFNLR